MCTIKNIKTTRITQTEALSVWEVVKRPEMGFE